MFDDVYSVIIADESTDNVVKAVHINASIVGHLIGYTSVHTLFYVINRFLWGRLFVWVFCD